MNKVYPERINWEDEPSVATPLSATNLNKIDYATYEMDNRIITLDTSKANQSDLLQCIKSYTYDTETGVLTFTWQNGTTSSIDFNIEKIPVSFSMDANGVITMETDDGTTYTADVGSLIKTYTFTDSTTVDFTVTTDASGNKTITAIIKDGSITADKIDPQYMASINLAVSQAEGYANSASGSATAAGQKALESEGYAVGTQNGTPVGPTSPYYENNSKYYAKKAEQTDIGQIEKVKVSWDDASESVQKNLIPYPYRITSGTVNRGITWTYDSDGILIADGTVSTTNLDSYGELVLNSRDFAPGNYIISGCLAGGSATKYWISIYINGAEIARDYGSGATFTVQDGDSVTVQARVYRNTTVSNLIFKPMIRKATIKDDTYAPYILNNNQLVGWSQAEKSVKKNLNSYPYYNTNRTTNGITFTDNGDGTVTANGTATANAIFFCHSRNINYANSLIVPNGKYIFNGCPAGGNDGTEGTYVIRVERTYNDANNVLGRDIGNGVTIALNGDDYFSDKVVLQISIVIRSGATVNNLVFKPMLRYANVKDDTFAPYIPDNTELVSWKANGVLGAKNMMKYPYYQTTQTVNGITTTDNGDGTLTFNGTCTANSVIFRLESNDANIEIPLGKARYILTWVEAGKHNPYFRLDIGLTKSNDTTEVKNGDLGTIEIDNTNGQYKGIFAVSVYSGSGQTVNNLLFKPMLRLAEDTDDTYQPYAMTNYELTQKIAELQAQINALV